MAIEFECSQCQSTLRVADENQGKKARCPNCSMIMDVPSATNTPNTAYVSNPTDSPAAQDDINVIAQSGTADQETVAYGESTAVIRWSMRTPDGQIYGPVDQPELESWMAEGRVSSQCQLQKEGEHTWRDAALVFPQIAAAKMSHVGGAAFATPANPYQSPGYRGVSRPTGSYVRPHNGVVILLMGIFGIVLCPILSVVAWIMGSNELDAIKRGRVDPAGKGLATAGMVLGIVNVIICIIAVLGGCMLAAIGG